MMLTTTLQNCANLLFLVVLISSQPFLSRSLSNLILVSITSRLVSITSLLDPARSLSQSCLVVISRIALVVSSRLSLVVLSHLVSFLASLVSRSCVALILLLVLAASCCLASFLVSLVSCASLSLLPLLISRLVRSLLFLVVFDAKTTNLL
jgi:hypothetical protein